MDVTRAFRQIALLKNVARVITVLTALMLVGGAMAASGQLKDAKAATIVDLTYTVWFSPAMTGVVGGDIIGTFGGGVTSTPIPGTPLVQLKATYVIMANDPSESFTAILQGDLNTKTNAAVLNGVVTWSASGTLTGERVHSEFQVVNNCPLNPSGPCFPGTLQVQ
jgi:hypothetical protein